jgi:hypothetical protein
LSKKRIACPSCFTEYDVTELSSQALEAFYSEMESKGCWVCGEKMVRIKSNGRGAGIA